jgi:hypothetical protein
MAVDRMGRDFLKVFVLGSYLILSAALSAARAGAASSVPDFSGVWSRAVFGLESPDSGPGPVRNLSRKPSGRADQSRAVGDISNPILRPAAKAVLLSKGAIMVSGHDYPTPSNQCRPMVVPYIFRVQGMEMAQGKDEVFILYMQDHQFRRIRLNAKHPAHLVPSWYGDSVGHYEGNTLVVDTIGVKTGPVPNLDQYGTPFSAALHVIERYRLIDNEEARKAQARAIGEYGPPATEQGAIVDRKYAGDGLQVEFTVEDGTYFTMPWSGKATYLRARDEWVENVCAENMHEYYSPTDTAVPTAAKSDF